MKMSQPRVDPVKAYLVSKDPDQNPIEATRFGEDQPITKNATVPGKEHKKDA